MERCVLSRRRARARAQRLVRGPGARVAAASPRTASSWSGTRPTSTPIGPSRAGIEPAGLRVGYVGVMGSQDAIETLVDGVADRRGRAGPGRRPSWSSSATAKPARASRRRSTRLGLREQVRFHGYLGPARLRPDPGRLPVHGEPRSADAVQRRLDDGQGARLPGHRPTGRRLRPRRDARDSSARAGSIVARGDGRRRSRRRLIDLLRAARRVVAGLAAESAAATGGAAAWAGATRRPTSCMPMPPPA